MEIGRPCCLVNGLGSAKAEFLKQTAINFLILASRRAESQKLSRKHGTKGPLYSTQPDGRDIQAVAIRCALLSELTYET